MQEARPWTIVVGQLDEHFQSSVWSFFNAIFFLLLKKFQNDCLFSKLVLEKKINMR